MIVGSLPDVARSWAEANPALKPGYIAVYDALGDVSGSVFAVSWASLGVFGIVFSIALSRDDDFPRALTWISAASGVALAGAVAAGVGFQVSTAFALLLLGLLLSYVVLVASSVRVWVLAANPDSKAAKVAEPVGNGSTP
jgi:fatty acid desaturase